MQVLFVISILLLFASSANSISCSRSAKQELEDTHVAKCSKGSNDLVSGRLVNGSISRGNNSLPPWIDLGLAKKGQKFAMKHMLPLAASHLYGLMLILAFPDAYTVLLYTNVTDNLPGATKRYISTIKQVSTWYAVDLYNGTNQTEAIRSLLYVRNLHAQAMANGNRRLYSEKANLINPKLYESASIDHRMWDALALDLKISQIPNEHRKFPKSHINGDGSTYAVNQFQLAMTQFAFVGFPVLFPERLNIFDATAEELYAFNHLWAVLGYVLGIDDEYNIALQPNLAATKANYQLIWDDWYTPVVFNCDFYCKYLVETVLKGLHEIPGMPTPKNMLLMLYSSLFKILVFNLDNQRTLEDRLSALDATWIPNFLIKMNEVKAKV